MMNLIDFSSFKKNMNLIDLALFNKNSNNIPTQLLKDSYNKTTGTFSQNYISKMPVLILENIKLHENIQ